MRQIVLDTETTGLNPAVGHRIIEIGCVELLNRQLTGSHYHTYLNPGRDSEQAALEIHGLSTEFLQDKPLFKDIIQELISYINGAELIIHNAPFDTGFINAELMLIQWPKTLKDYCTVCDTLVLASKKHPGQRNNLDALCKRYDIDNSKRQLHGALLDAEILAHVYLAMTGGQGNLFDDMNNLDTENTLTDKATSHNLSSKSPVLLPNAHETKQHNDFIQFLIKTSGVNLWKDKV